MGSNPIRPAKQYKIRVGSSAAEQRYNANVSPDEKKTSIDQIGFECQFINLWGGVG